MKGLFKNFLAKILDPNGLRAKRKLLSKYKKLGWIRIGSNTDITNMQIDLREPIKGRNYITIGDNCIIQGKLVIENNLGQITISDNTFIGTGVLLISVKRIEIGNNVMIAWGTTILDHNSHSISYKDRVMDMQRSLKGIGVDWDIVDKREILIEDNSWIGFNSIIMKGVTIKEGTIIAAGSVVTKSTERFTLWGGNPASFIKNLN